MDEDIKKILDKYQAKIKENTETIDSYEPGQGFTREYKIFREEALTKTSSAYERICNSLGNIHLIKLKEEDYKKLEDSIDVIHLEITPEQASGFVAFISLLLIFISLALGGVMYFLSKDPSQDLSTILLPPMILILVSVLLIKPLTNIPNYLAARWRLRATNQMVLCILYIVMYMRHTSNLEHAIKFASDHIGNPLALDFKKIFWDIETGKYSNIKQSLDAYLLKWRSYNLEFVESFHLIQGSLLESSEERRITLLEKSLEVILNGTYEKMLHYAQDLKNPITMLHMLGVILPILGLVVLPLFGSLVSGSGSTKIIFLFLIYNIALPLVVYFLGVNILSKRPTGYSESDLIEQNPEFKKYKNILINLGTKEIQISPFWISFLIFFLISSISLIPLIFSFLNLQDFEFLGLKIIDYKLENGLSCVQGKVCYGPFGVGAVVLSLFLPLGIALGLGTYYKLRTKNLIKIRNETKKLELEFAGSLFQLGNRIGDGIPVEASFGEVAKNMEGTPTGDFFRRVAVNIQKLGMSIKEAIFNKDNGAMWFYPSSLIESSMKVLLESSRKGSQVVSKSLVSISLYIDRIHQVNERLKDLLSEIISSMKSQISFLTPVIAGIVVGISTMIVTILGKLSAQLTETSQANVGETGFAGLGTVAGLFEIKNIIPSYYLQLIIGLYVIEIGFILTVLSNGIENGADSLNEQYYLGKNLYKSSILYFIVAFFITIIFSLLAIKIQLG
jgi:Flp pilus assembly protein TadB